MTNKLTISYIAPQIEVVEAIVEAGFATSSNVEDPIENGTQGWN
jgi:hypothetical protein